jgi:hypothetical protein
MAAHSHPPLQRQRTGRHCALPPLSEAAGQKAIQRQCGLTLLVVKLHGGHWRRTDCLLSGAEISLKRPRR